jgi:tRNA pseudouridine38-40 synthase
MTRWKLTIEYDGAPYSGWQYQDHAPSVQDEIEKAIKQFCQQDIRIYVAGRTDAGVHALGQVAHFDLDYGDRDISGYELAKALNAHLRMAGQTIAILHAEIVSDDFHARFSAKNKLYIYRIINRPAPLTFELGKAWQFKRPLDVDSMQDAAQVLLGVHDFTSFRDSQCQAKSPIKTLDRFDITRQGDLITCEVEGRSFLHHQVRNMVGTLSHVGEGKWSKDDVCAALEARDRTKGGITCPPDGLYLARIDY